MRREVLHSDNITKNRVKKLSILILGFWLCGTGIDPNEAEAQTRSELGIEATPFHGTISYARGPRSDVRAGFEAGFGFPQIDVSLAPNRHAFTQIAHVGVFGRFATTNALQLDLGVRAGFSDVRDLGADDFPDPYAALSGALLYGKGSLTVGARLSAGYAFPYGDPATFVAGVSPVLRYTLNW
jgi:hypothetical protein